MAPVRGKLSDFLAQTRIALDNVLANEELLELLADCGYSATKILEGKALEVKANELTTKQQKEYGEQYSATQKLDELCSELEEIYKKHMKLTRVAYEDNNAKLATLGLNGKRKQAINEWGAQVKQFYDHIFDETGSIPVELMEYGLTDTKLNKGVEKLAEVLEAQRSQMDSSADAQRATAERDLVLEELNSWVNKFYKVARIAFEDVPQAMEKLGITV